MVKAGECVRRRVECRKPRKARRTETIQITTPPPSQNALEAME